MNIFIGCGSLVVDEKFNRNSIKLIKKIASIEDINLVFGAYNQGMMGICYDVFKQNNKKITGITLDIYKDQLNDLECNQEIIVETTMDRMKEIYKNSDVLLFLPGGLGTYTEIFSAIEETRTKNDNKLLIMYNDGFFFTPMIREMYHLFENKFIQKSIGKYCKIESNEEEIVRLIEKEQNLWKN